MIMTHYMELLAASPWNLILFMVIPMIIGELLVATEFFALFYKDNTNNHWKHRNKILSVVLGVLGICGGGGYTFATAQSDKRIKSVATVSLFNTDLVRSNGMNDSAVATIQERLKQAAEARTLESKGDVQYSANADLTKITDEQIAQMPAGLYREGFEYYGKTHFHPNSTPRYTTSSLLDLMTWDATNQAELIDQPLLMIAGSAADTRYMTEQAFAKATGTKNKELVLIDGASHIETYWKPEYVKQISEKLTGFFGKNL